MSSSWVVSFQRQAITCNDKSLPIDVHQYKIFFKCTLVFYNFPLCFCVRWLWWSVPHESLSKQWAVAEAKPVKMTLPRRQTRTTMISTRSLPKVGGNSLAPGRWEVNIGSGNGLVPSHYCDVIMSAMVSQITGVSIVCSTLSSGADQIKYQSFVSLAFVREIHWWPVDSPHKGPVMWKMFPFHDVIMMYQAITWTNVDWVMCRHMVSQGHNMFNQ